MLEALLPPLLLLLLLLAVGRLEVVLEPKVAQAPRSSVGSPSSSSSLAEADVDVAGQERPQSVLPVLAREAGAVLQLVVVRPAEPHPAQPSPQLQLGPPEHQILHMTVMQYSVVK